MHSTGHVFKIKSHSLKKHFDLVKDRHWYIAGIRRRAVLLSIVEIKKVCFKAIKQITIDVTNCFCSQTCSYAFLNLSRKFLC